MNRYMEEQLGKLTTYNLLFSHDKWLKMKTFILTVLAIAVSLNSAC